MRNKFLNKGFTLIELLVVIAILGVLGIGLIAAINPLDKINSAGDARVISDIGVLARTAESYATSNNGHYSPTIAGLVTAGELKLAPIAPAGYSGYTYTGSPAGCTIDGTGAGYCVSVVITNQLKSTKYSATPFQRYESSTGKTCQVALVGNACP